ncbi:DUF3224 domain-containing protein [Enemella sp. A6]|uniref:DUF3224 domain-containing protein n=1 Tax=Enemella sp. A6 TaxID=3440152 RepID=UPI003EBA0426
MTTATGTFTVEMAGAESPLTGAIRADLTKTWTGELAGTSTGVMLSAGDASTGSAGYVAIEVFTGSVHGVEGGFAFLQLATMDGGVPQMSYVISPGSGTGGLTGITGTLDLDVIDGEHRVSLDYRLGG